MLVELFLNFVIAMLKILAEMFSTILSFRSLDRSKIK